MIHLTEEQLILHYYGEADSSAHLNTCPACRRDMGSLRATLDACANYPVPERPPGFEKEVWHLVWREHSRPRQGSSRWWGAWRIPAFAAALAAMLILAFLAGRFSRPQANVLTAQSSYRILQSALGEHLDRSQVLLVELAHTELPDIAESQQRARELLGENRLYRQAAAFAGDNSIAGVLDDLERVLLSIVHSPSDISSPELRQIQRRIEEEGVLFKIRVLDSNLHPTEKL